MDVKLLGIWFWICTLPAIQVSCESPNIRSVNSKIGVKDAFDADDADDAAPDLDPVVEDSFDAAANAAYFVGEDGYLVDSDVDNYDEDSYDADADVDYMYRSSSNRTHTQHNTTHPLHLDEPKEYDHDHTNHHQDPLQQQKHQYQNKDDEHQHLHHNNQQQQQHEDDHHDEHLHHHEDEEEEQHHENDHQLYEHEIHKIHQHGHMHQQHQKLEQHEDEHNHDDVHDKHQHDIKQRQHEDEHKHGQMNNRVHSNIDMKKQKKDNLIDVSDVENDHENRHNHDDTHDSSLQKKPTSASAQKQQHNNKVVHVHSNDPSHQPYHSTRDHINIYTDMMQADARFHEHNSYYHFEPQHHKQYRNHPHYPKKDSIRVPNHKQKEDHGHGHQHGTRKRLDEISVSIWLAGFGSILFISLVGVGSVLFLPMLKGNRSETILQFLIAVAVGTLVGDAFIHLVPHAFLQTHDTSTTWKGFVATMVILGFFTLDQILSLKGMSHSHSHVHAVPTDEPAHHAVPTVQHHGTRTVPTVQYHDAEPSQPTSPPPTPAIYKECRTGDESMSFLSADSGHPIVSNHHHLHTQDSHSERGEESFSKPSNFSSTNLMVIIGDAIHNFADGIAIGAAFSMGYATGLSTSIAVLCHELPHEIGDFAILIQNGMKTRTALFFNVISSITGFIGMCIGLLLGSTGDFSTWLLAGIVGVFLYVALVSMLPELRANNLRDVVVNVTGISGGAVLLLIIGLYEEKLINLFTFS